ncbi:MAG: S8 family serine peptidase [Candidatus Thermoplasmatota archaeon]|nr:S8 family serine peptidase [Candidatus Thermoplasmatota archaeon]
MGYRLLIMAIVMLPLIVPPADITIDEPVLGKLSRTLEGCGVYMEKGRVQWLSDSDLAVLVHVSEPQAGMYRGRLNDLGLRVGHRFTYVDVYQATIRASLLPSLTRMDWVMHIEYDAPVVKDLEVSTEAVKAPRVWSSAIKEGNSMKDGVTGSGVSIAVVDSGLDAGHPDLDYGSKTVVNIKAAQAGSPWVEMENTDTSVGHGSHCAGIAAGNGDASAGGRSGVAPGASLVGLSLSEGSVEVSTANYLYGLEWVFDNSRPGATYPHPPIRVCTNSWHTTEGEYDPNMALSIIINRLTYENNVVCTFSAGNDGRQDPKGTTVWTSQQGATPCAIMVAAHARDGTSVAEFTSHGQVGLNHTYPDVGAPGVRIWAAHARRTGISAGSKIGGNPNPYYLAISGTSMSTPHVAGTVALLFEACPSLGISETAEDYSGGDHEWFHFHPYRFVHEAELILEASATRIPYIEGKESETHIYVNDTSTGWGGRSIDYVQGYGFIDIEKAVGIALTLDRLRRENPHRKVSVMDALFSDADVTRTSIVGRSDKLVTSWNGEYSRFNDQNGKPLLVQNQTRYLFVPDGTSAISIDISYVPLSMADLHVGGISIEVDYDLDGVADFGGDSPLFSRPGTYEIPIRTTGVFYGITVRGQGIRILKPLRDTSYVELRIPYSMRAVLTISGDNATVFRSVYSNAMRAPLMTDVSSGVSIETTLDLTLYDLDRAAGPWQDERPEGGGSRAFPYIILAVLLLGTVSAVLYIYLRKRR